jgi:hypothetical protein
MQTQTPSSNYALLPSQHRLHCCSMCCSLSHIGRHPSCIPKRPCSSTLTSETVAHHFVTSVFKFRKNGPAGRAGPLRVSDRDARFTSAFKFWTGPGVTGLHAALGASGSLIFGLPHHHTVAPPAARSSTVSLQMCCAPLPASGQMTDRTSGLVRVPLVEFAINDSASPLGSGHTPFYADRGLERLTTVRGPGPAGHYQ